MFKKINAWLTLFITNLLLTPISVFADGFNGEEYYNGLIDTSIDRGGALNNVNGVLLDVLAFARGAGIVVCIIMLVWCAIQLAMSSGNNQKRQLAMEGIKNVIIAVAIVGAATVIVSIAHGLLSSGAAA